MKRQPSEWEKIIANETTDRGLISKIYNGEKTDSLTSGAGKNGQAPVKNETRTLPNTIHKDKIKME